MKKEPEDGTEASGVQPPGSNSRRLAVRHAWDRWNELRPPERERILNLFLEGYEHHALTAFRGEKRAKASLWSVLATFRGKMTWDIPPLEAVFVRLRAHLTPILADEEFRPQLLQGETPDAADPGEVRARLVKGDKKLYDRLMVAANGGFDAFHDWVRRRDRDLWDQVRGLLCLPREMAETSEDPRKTGDRAGAGPPAATSGWARRALAVLVAAGAAGAIALTCLGGGANRLQCDKMPASSLSPDVGRRLGSLGTVGGENDHQPAQPRAPTIGGLTARECEVGDPFDRKQCFLKACTAMLNLGRWDAATRACKTAMGISYRNSDLRKDASAWEGIGPHPKEVSEDQALLALDALIEIGYRSGNREATRDALDQYDNLIDRHQVGWAKKNYVNAALRVWTGEPARARAMFEGLTWGMPGGGGRGYPAGCPAGAFAAIRLAGLVEPDDRDRAARLLSLGLWVATPAISDCDPPWGGPAFPGGNQLVSEARMALVHLNREPDIRPGLLLLADHLAPGEELPFQVWGFPEEGQVAIELQDPAGGRSVRPISVSFGYCPSSCRWYSNPEAPAGTWQIRVARPSETPWYSFLVAPKP